MRCVPFRTLVPALLLAVACNDPSPTAPRVPRSASMAASCSLGMSDADANATLDALTAKVTALETAGSLSSGQANALRKHLDNIRKSIAAGNYCAAASQLAAFKEQVTNLVTGGVLTDDEAAPLTGGADDVLQGAHYVSFMSDRDGNYEIYSARSDGTQLVNMTNNAGWDATGRWSPDGSTLAFASNREGVFKIYVVNADGSGLTRLTNSDVTDGNLHWSPDGTRIAFVRHRDPREVWVMDANGSNQTRVIDGDWPQWSPDGTQLVYSAYRNDNFDIYAIDRDGTDEIRLTTDPAFDGYPSWSPAGSQVVWRTERHGNTELYSIRPDGTGLQRLTTTTVFNHPSSWSPDGTVLAINRCTTGGMCQIYTIRSDGTGERNLTNDPLISEFDPVWSSDGKRLVFNRVWDLNSFSRDVLIMNPDGTARTKLTNSTSDNFSVTWRPR